MQAHTHTHTQTKKPTNRWGVLPSVAVRSKDAVTSRQKMQQLRLFVRRQISERLLTEHRLSHMQTYIYTHSHMHSWCCHRTADAVTASEDDAELTNNENSRTVTILHSTHSQVKYNYSDATHGHMSPTPAAPVLIITSLATELATPRVMDVGYIRTYGHLTAFNKWKYSENDVTMTIQYFHL